jgi:hypothetical protein
MTHKPPTPVVRSLLACREVANGPNGEMILIAPLSVTSASRFPASLGVQVYAQITSMRGEYLPALQVRDGDDQVVWSLVMDHPMMVQDPLEVHHVPFRGYEAWLPRPGRYEVVLLMNDDEVARYPFTVGFRPPEPA